MNIRSKIIFIVLPLLIAALLINGTISSTSAKGGMTRIAQSFLSFKAQELEKYAQNQWNLLVSNNLTEETEYLAVTKKSVAAYAGTLVRSNSEIIFAAQMDGNAVQIDASTSDIELTMREKTIVREFANQRVNGWIEDIELNGSRRVSHAFWFEPFSWYVVISEDADSFYREVDEITNQSYIILGVSVFVSVILLLFFTGYLTRPVRKMRDAMREIIKTNDLSTQVKVEFRDEIGDLANTFNVMTGQLGQAYDQIKNFAFKAVWAQRVAEEAKDKERKIRSLFERYVPASAISEVLEKPTAALVGDTRIVPILFTDIRNFTTISQGIPPDELVTILNEYFELLGEIVYVRGGFIDKYIGDAIMAIYGSVESKPDDVEQAVLTALEMQKKLVVFNAKMRSNGRPEFKTGIGINRGGVVIGNIGFERKMDYTIIGDMVNYGSRLEGLTKMYHQDLIFSESVFRKIKGIIPCRQVDIVEVKGRKKADEMVYTAATSLTVRQKEGWAYHQAGMKRYISQKFKDAKKYFTTVQKYIPGDPLAGIFIERCQQYIENPPPANWKGVTEMDTK